MSSLLLILLSAVLVCHYAPALTGTRVFLESDGFDTSLGVAVVSLMLMTLIAPLSYVLDRAVLDRFDLGHLRLFLLIIAIMSLAQIAAFLLARSKRWAPQPLFALLMTAHCGILGVALLAAGFESFTSALWAGVGIGLAFAVLLLCFTTLQQRVDTANVPDVFRGAPVALITLGLMGLALMGLTGLVPD